LLIVQPDVLVHGGGTQVLVLVDVGELTGALVGPGAEAGANGPGTVVETSGGG